MKKVLSLRTFFSKSSFLMGKLSLLCLLICSIAEIQAQGFGQSVNFNGQWSFHLGDIQYGGREYMDCSEWPVVDLPHDWSVKQQAREDLASCTGFLPGGIAWYRKSFEMPTAQKGEKVYVYFEGIYNNSEIFINGKWIGKRPNGYISFMYDLSPYIKWEGKNTLAVRVNHSEDADSRWYTGSGIYRDVYLVFSGPVHISQWGVFYQTDIKENDKTADIRVATTIDNTTTAEARLRLVQELYDAEGLKVAVSSLDGIATARSKTAFKQPFELSSPRLWSTDEPYLYSLKTLVYQGNDLIDESVCPLGIRSLQFDADKGFALNGSPMKVKGVCVHHDAGALGAAFYKSVWRTRLETLKSLGVNAIRTSHNPQAPGFYDLCDELGFLVMDEAFDEWEYPKNKWIEGWNKGTPGHQGSSEYFREWSTRDIRDMVMRDRNHPSVMMWSIGNEVDYPNDPYTHPVLEKEGIGQQHIRAFLKDHPRAERLGEIAKDLVTAVKEADSSRAVTAALAGAVMSNYTDYPFVLDVVGYNYTENKYDSDHQLYPERILYGSENRHDMPAWNAVKDKNFIFGQFLWTGLDYLGESGPWPSRGFTTGLLDLAGNIKPLGYFRKGLWSETPTAYLGSTWSPPQRKKDNHWSMYAPAFWQYQENASVAVVCYTNGEEAELYLDGKIYGEKKSYDSQSGIIGWQVEAKPGVLSVIAYNQGKAVAFDTIYSNTEAVKIQAEVLPAKDGDLLRQIRVTILDTNGRPSVWANNELTCLVEGGCLLGMENGSQDASENFQDNRQHCIQGRMLIFVRKSDSGQPISVKLTAEGLEGVGLKID